MNDEPEQITLFQLEGFDEDGWVWACSPTAATSGAKISDELCRSQKAYGIVDYDKGEQ